MNLKAKDQDSDTTSGVNSESVKGIVKLEYILDLLSPKLKVKMIITKQISL